MGGWVTAETLAHDSNLLGAVIISAGDFGAIGLRAQQNRAAVVSDMNDNRESLAGVTGESMADEVKEHGKDWSFRTLAPELIHRNLLVLYSNDFVKADSLELIKTSRPRVGRRSPRNMSSPITAGPITESLSSRWSSIGLIRYPVLADRELF
jgi:hypothetical protein